MTKTIQPELKKAKKTLIHKQLLTHESGAWTSNVFKYDLVVTITVKEVLAHNQITLKINSTSGSVFPNSKYDIFLCSYGEYKKPKDYTIEDLKAEGIKKILEELLPKGQKAIESIYKQTGINVKLPYQLPEKISQKDIPNMLMEGKIRINDRSKQQGRIVLRPVNN